MGSHELGSLFKIRETTLWKTYFGSCDLKNHTILYHGMLPNPGEDGGLEDDSQGRHDFFLQFTYIAASFNNFPAYVLHLNQNFTHFKKLPLLNSPIAFFPFNQTDV